MKKIKIFPIKIFLFFGSKKEKESQKLSETFSNHKAK